MVAAIAFNVKAGGNNKVHDYGTALVGGTAITGDTTQDTTLVNYIGTLATQAVRNEIISNSGGNNLSQSRDTSITADTNSPACATVASAITTLVGIITSGISSSSMSGTAISDTYIDISTVGTRSNEESTMCLLGSHLSLIHISEPTRPY